MSIDLRNSYVMKQAAPDPEPAVEQVIPEPQPEKPVKKRKK